MEIEYPDQYAWGCHEFLFFLNHLPFHLFHVEIKLGDRFVGLVDNHLANKANNLNQLPLDFFSRSIRFRNSKSK